MFLGYNLKQISRGVFRPPPLPARELGKKNEKGERKKEENYIKTGEKALKMHLFGL